MLRHCILYPVIWLLLLSSMDGFAQEYSYTHYDTKDGLAGSTVYCAIQDHDGFLWIGTESGLSRFDGNHFKNFTIADGLPSDDVFGIFPDLKNRIWIYAFRNAISYYKDGQIHNQQNDPVLRQIHVKGQPYAVFEDTAGNIILKFVAMGETELVQITAAGKVTSFWKEGRDRIPPPKRLVIRSGLGSLPVWAVEIPNYMRSAINDRFFYVNDGAGQKKNIHLFAYPDSLFCYFPGNSRQAHWGKWPPGVYDIRYINEHLLELLQQSPGIGIYDINTADKKEFFPDIVVHAIHEDGEKNLWFSTKGSGLFKISNNRFKNYIFGNQSVRSIQLVNDRLYIGTDHNELWSIPLADSAFFNQYSGPKPVREKRSIDFIAANKHTAYVNYAGSDFYRLKSKIEAIPKSLHLYHDTLLIADIGKAYTITYRNMLHKHIIYQGRTTSAYHQNGIFYIGTFSGLYKVVPGKSHIFLGDSSPVFKCHISCFAESADSTLLIGAYGGGVTAYKNGRIITNIVKTNGLSSNSCRSLFVDGNTLWAGTDNGLNKIDITPGRYRVLQVFTQADGLNSDAINAVYSRNGYVYAGTPRGVNVFDEKRISRHSISNLVLTDVTVSGKRLDLLAKAPVLKHKDNNIRFEYSGISFLSGKDITYQYRLLGLNDDWQYTKENVLSYPTLPSGSYTLQLIAINKFGDKSRMVEYPFEIEKRVWETWWFQVIALLLIIGLTAWIVRYSIRRSSLKERERFLTEQKMMELEQMALRAQMNPHFIFNCLNSMQRYILKQDVKSANFYLSRFAGLVRQTLDNSTRVYIPLVEEIRYLTNYLELERLQLAEQFSYTITADEEIDQDRVLIPNMVLQPYVENAIKHGMRHLDKPGRITIRFRVLTEEQVLECVIEDNGKGIAWTQEQKQRHPSGHQSKGMSITDQRVKTLNQLNDNRKDIFVEINDIAVPGAPVSGTRVTVRFPL